jgi:error-prone DNA polymerase
VRPTPAQARADEAAARTSTDPAARAAAQALTPARPEPVGSVQLTLDLGDAPVEGRVSGLPELTRAEATEAELEILGLDVTRHVVDGYADLLDALEVTRSRDLLRRRSGGELLVAGVKVATQTPPLRSGRRVVFITLDDATGPVDATFFKDAQGPYARTVFDSWLLLVRGALRRTGHRGVSVRATGAWELTALHERWRTGGVQAVLDVLAAAPRPGAPGPLVAPPANRSLWHRSPGSLG